MIKVTLVKGLNLRSGQVPLRFRLRDGEDVDLVYDSGHVVKADELKVFDSDGRSRAMIGGYDPTLKQLVDRCMGVVPVVYLEMLQSGAKIDGESFQKAVEARLSRDVVPEIPVVKRFREYLDEEKSLGRYSGKMHRDAYALSRKLERYLVIRGLVDVSLDGVTTEMVTDFEKFCIDEYQYAANPAYAALYPRDCEGSKYWPKHKLKEEPLRKLLNTFYAFWNDMVLFGEIVRSPYEGYVEWMQPKKYKSYTELVGEPMSLTMDEFAKVVSTPVPESMAQVRNAFILQCCTGCKGEDFKKIGLRNVRVSREGIPYIYYRHYGVDVETPLVRVAFDIMMRTRCEFYFGSYMAAYNKRIKEFLRYCGITRELNVFNVRTGESELVQICDVISQSHLHQTHMDIIREMECLRGLRGDFYTGAKALAKRKNVPMEEQFKTLNRAFGQKPFRVDENLNIIEGVPFVALDPIIYKEQPDKLPSGRTNPYVISELIPMSAGVGREKDRIEVRYGPALARERKLAVCGDQVLCFLETLDDEHRVQIWYGLMLLKKLSDFKVTFVRDCGDTIYEMRTALRGYTYSTYFYINGETVVLLHCCLDEKHRRHKATGTGNLPGVRELRWMHVVGEVGAMEYDSVIDLRFGESGSIKREVFEMRACCSYVSQTLRRVRIDAGLVQEDVFSRWGFKSDCGNMTQAETGIRVLPYKYLSRLLDALGMKAVIVRPGVDGWNAISYTMTLEQMLESIGEPVKNWRKKNKN